MLLIALVYSWERATAMRSCPCSFTIWRDLRGSVVLALAQALSCAQAEGYEAALACDGELLEQTRLKVEPCRTPRPLGCAAPAAPAPTQHKGAAPKACRPALTRAA